MFDLFPGLHQSAAPIAFQGSDSVANEMGNSMITISDHQRQVLVEHALASNWDEQGGPAEAQYEDVIVDLSMERPVADRELFVAFLWRRVTVAAQAGPSRKDHWAWSAAVQLLDQLGENLEDVFTGREQSGLRSAGR